MGAPIQIEFDKESKKKFDKNMDLYAKKYPEETWKAIVKILFDIKLLAQRKIKADKHIITNRLRSSIFVKTPGQQYAQTSTNAIPYSDDTGRSFKRGLDVDLKKFEGAVGTNVEYAIFVEKIDSYLQYAFDSVDMDKRFDEIKNSVK